MPTHSKLGGSFRPSASARRGPAQADLDSAATKPATQPLDLSAAARLPGAAGRSPSNPPLLCTKGVATITGFSVSYFEKGRSYGYGPAFIKIGSRVRYRLEDVLAWIETQAREPGTSNV